MESYVLSAAPRRRRGSTRGALLASALTAFGIVGGGFPAAAQQTTFTLDYTNSTSGTFSASSGSLSNDALSAANIAGNLSSGSNVRNYVATTFTATSAGNFTFGQTSAPVDTVMILYLGTFNPASPATNAVIGSDDAGGSAVCGLAGYCPQVTVNGVTAGQTLTLVVTTFSPNRSLGNFIGPDVFLNSLSGTASQNSTAVVGAPSVGIQSNAPITLTQANVATSFANFILNTATVANNVAVNANGGSITGGGSSYTLSGILSGSGALSFLGTGTIILTGANTLTGGVSIVSGLTLALGSVVVNNNTVYGTLATASGIAANGIFSISGTNGASIVNLSGTGSVALGAQTLTITNASSTFSGVIGGTGGLILSGGTLTLTGANTFTGSTDISQGATLILSGAGDLTGAVAANGTFNIGGTTSGASILDLSGAGTVTLGAQTLTLTNASSTFSGVIGGTGGLTLSGGTLTLTGANTFTGAATVNQGATLVLSGSGSLAGGVAANGTFSILSNASIRDLSGAGTVTLGANTLTLSNASSTFSGVIGGTGGLILSGGTFTLTGANTYSGGTSIGQGATLQLGNGGATGSITGNVTNSGTLSFNRTGNTTYGGIISGTGGLTVIGGNLILTGANTYTGATSIQGGRLAVNGTIVSLVNVGNGGTLGGSGTVGGITLVSGGALAPGNSIGTLNVSGNVSLAAGSTYQVEIQGTQADRTNATGTANVAGSNLAVTSLDGQWPRPRTTYRILSATGGVSGTFDEVTLVDAPGNVRQRVIYGTTDIDLQLRTVLFAEMATNRNQLSVGLPLDQLGDAALTPAQTAIMETLYDLPDTQIARALTELSGEVHTAAMPLATRTAGLFLQTILDPSLQGRQQAGACGETLPGQAGAAQATHCHDAGHYTVWVAPFAGNGVIKGDRGIGSSARTEQIAGMIVGADMRIDANSMVGFALGGASAQARISNGLGSLNSNVLMAGVYGMHNVGPLSLGAALGYSMMEAETKRSMGTVGVNGLESDYTVTTWSGRVQAAYALIQQSDFSFGPYAFAQAFNVNRPSFQETGAGGAVADLGVSSRSRSATDSQTELGLQLLDQGQIGSMPASAFIRAGWRYALSQSDDVRARITSLPGTDFTVTGAQADEHMASIGAGLDLTVAPGVSVGGRVESLVGANTSFVTGSVRVRMEF